MTTNGVVRTDAWLEDIIDQPEEICKKIDPAVKNARAYYDYLLFFGMYRPSKMSKVIFKQLKTANAWEKINEFYKKYKKLWNGPEINIYILPINGLNRSLIRQTNGKSGVTFKEKMILFLGPTEDLKEWESLFVHEYNHATRMSYMSGDPLNYSLLDSLILEGLAEYAVEHYCGEKYLAPWTRAYSDKLLKRFWNSDFKDRLTIKKKDPTHDNLLFGRKFVPTMMGYAIGYKIISEYSKNNIYSIGEMFSSTSENFITRNIFDD
ncbi:hypothetical protein B5V88_16725 [Heyndrickxia sporothermodurans]|uniref:DUF2268 domain-containing protein n=2 Tax=Heyndrickxia sporothermodurans TaxID=46224 RepID=A0AB37H6X8_9BACI|nr:DUF2268 domain-containing putative Zn-dependent protease [Heyndrickxia sporothermodurans]MBL5769258.1 hypothetical protein [Heyndrickxia sporothermodurans]MBL5773036.1 hypothetical protein [Heyndrickxia sporothermodurans]MBL5776521.1 hypothetical protein [Heyndrickxia sporothermodurans]MBL5779995.1 hypothetical protein [Heyndrickxia sporothermodurans]MBL5783655.1 hypothetical protein [Heyndrickxia sporothermodurans]